MKNLETLEQLQISALEEEKKLINTVTGIHKEYIKHLDKNLMNIHEKKVNILEENLLNVKTKIETTLNQSMKNIEVEMIQNLKKNQRINYMLTISMTAIMTTLFWFILASYLTK